MTNYSYDTTIPNPPNDPADDCPLMQTNFSNSALLIDTDHVGFNTANGGNHKQVNFNTVQSAPGLNSGVSGLYTNTLSGYPALYYQTGSPSTNRILMGPTTASANGYTYLPGGIILQWGVKSSPGATGSVSFPLTFPTNFFSVSLTLLRNSGNQSVTLDSGTPPTTGGFNYLVSSGGSTSLYWVAVGN